MHVRWPVGSVRLAHHIWEPHFFGQVFFNLTMVIGLEEDGLWWRTAVSMILLVSVV